MRSELALKLVCGAAAAFLLYRVGLALVHIFPLFHVRIPDLPALAGATNAPAQKSTNAVVKSTKTGTNVAQTVVDTNGRKNALRAVSTGAPPHDARTGSAMVGTDRTTQDTNQISPRGNAGVQVAERVKESTNAIAGKIDRGTNSQKESASGPASSRVGMSGPSQGMPPGMPPGMGGMPGMPPGMMPGGMPGMPGPGPTLAPEIQTRIDRIIESEILAPVMRPMPMALLGIAGKDVFLRAPNGQTGLVKEGDQLGGVKVVRVGLNRVLVEEQGQTKELTIFSGFGSESLLSAQKESVK